MSHSRTKGDGVNNAHLTDADLPMNFFLVATEATDFVALPTESGPTSSKRTLVLSAANDGSPLILLKNNVLRTQKVQF